MDKGLHPGYPGDTLADKQSFRLISLQPGNGDALLTLRLFETRLQQAQPYEAVSYVWGDASQLVPVRVIGQNGQDTRMDITPNCRAALQRLRRKDTARTLWIDAICIDQSSANEKNHQLPLMMPIYRVATRVIVYLGTSTDDSKVAMNRLRAFNDPYRALEEDRYDVPIPGPDEQSALRVLFQSPWFHRVWVLQEISFARSALLIYGDQEVDWENVLYVHDWGVFEQLIQQVPYSVKYAASKRWEEDDLMTHAERLVKLLQDTRHCGATDSRDKLYAILPLLDRDQDESSLPTGESLDEDEEQTRQRRVRIQVDYNFSEQRVFTDLAISLLQTMGLDTLRHVTQQPRIADLPSWVPDWSIPPFHWSQRSPLNTTPFAPRERQRAGFAKDPGPNSACWRLNPCGLQTWTVSEYPSMRGDTSTQLHLDGVLIGKLEKLGDVCDIDNSFLPLSQWESLVPSSKFLADERPLESIQSEAWKYDTRISSAFARTIFRDCVTNHTFLMKAITTIKRYNGGISQEDEHTASLIGKCHNKDKLSLIGTIKTMESHYVHPALWLCQCCDGKRFFATNTSFIGLAPEGAVVGDMVYVVKGATVPFVFRDGPSANTSGKGTYGGLGGGKQADMRYKELVGECYTYGVMTGGIWDSVADGTRKVEKIVVR